MSQSTRLPPHGTPARYKLERKLVAAGKLSSACDRCKQANAKAARERRANRQAAARRGTLHVVDGAQFGAHSEPEDASPPEPPADDTPGPVEAAIVADLAALTITNVPFFASLKVLAQETARDVDRAETAAARTAARKQLADMIKLLHPGGGDDGEKPLELYLGFDEPVVPAVPGLPS